MDLEQRLLSVSRDLLDVMVRCGQLNQKLMASTDGADLSFVGTYHWAAWKGMEHGLAVRRQVWSPERSIFWDAVSHPHAWWRDSEGASVELAEADIKSHDWVVV